ncbi:MAG TPA: DUF4282 domain-containing protein [Microlunatus sp.]
MTHPDPPQGPQDNPWQSGRPDQPPADDAEQQNPATSSPGQQPSEADQPTQINPAIQPDSGPGEATQDEPTQALGSQAAPPYPDQQQAASWQQPGGQSWQGGAPQQPRQTEQWQTQSSAGHPGQWQSQPSANQPGQPGQWQGQPSAGQWQTADGGQWAQSQPSAGHQPNQPGAGQQPAPGAFGAAPQYPSGGGGQPPTQPTGYQGGWQQPPRSERLADANPIRAAFDFSFSRYATPGLVKIIYILAVVIAALWWIGGTIFTFIAGAAASSVSAYGDSGGGGGTVLLGFVTLLLGWIPALLWVLFVRVVLEGLMALVRVAEDARGIRKKVDE